ncbi:MAG: YraN family protein [Solirubrobacterales bacterium]|nr:YraN family protein [Solirubrobacterales bacterium]
MTHSRLKTGRLAEDICAERIRSRGWQILGRNWRIRAGELDLIARDRGTVVVIEVKGTHSGIRTGPSSPVLAVGPEKQRRIRRLTSAWLAGPGRRVRFRDVRFDVVGVEFDRTGGITSYDHIENAF